MNERPRSKQGHRRACGARRHPTTQVLQGMLDFSFDGIDLMEVHLDPRFAQIIMKCLNERFLVVQDGGPQVLQMLLALSECGGRGDMATLKLEQIVHVVHECFC